MKYLFLLSLSVLLSTVALAQAPNKFRYQAVARNQSGIVITGDLMVQRM